MMVNIYGALYRQTGRKSHLLLSMNMGFGNTDNKCAHHGMNYENSTWDTETWNVALSAAWRYEVSRSFSITPFAKMSYVHASNKVKRTTMMTKTMTLPGGGMMMNTGEGNPGGKTADRSTIWRLKWE